MMIVVELAFQCLQDEKQMRPIVDKVLKVQKGIENEGCNIAVRMAPLAGLTNKKL